MRPNVKNGTPLHGPSLCETCVYAHIARGFRESEELVLCGAHERVHEVPFRVRDCSSYRDKTRPSFYEMERIALLIPVGEPKRTRGFVPRGHSEPSESEVELILTEPQPDSPL
jgi:hypothetical protein